MAGHHLGALDMWEGFQPTLSKKVFLFRKAGTVFQYYGSASANTWLGEIKKKGELLFEKHFGPHQYQARVCILFLSSRKLCTAVGVRTRRL